MYADETIIEDTFVSTTLVNASKMTLGGAELGTVLSEYAVRLNVLDEYLKTADVDHYYEYYFGVDLTDGGRARDAVSSYQEIYYPTGIEVANINGSNYAFVVAYNDNTIVVMNVSAIDGTIGYEIPFVANFNAASDPDVSSYLSNPWAIDHAEINGKHILFVTTISTDGFMIIDASNPQNLKMLSYTDDSDANFDKIANAYGIKAWEISGTWYLVVSSYSVQTTAYGGNGVQVIDISDLENPKFAASMVDGTDGFQCLNNPWGIDMIDVNGVPFLFVAARTDDCLQIIDMTDPTDPVAAFAYTDMYDTYSYMDDPSYVKAFEVNNRYYAAVNARIDRCITVIDVTDPYNPFEASSMAYSSSMSSTGQQYLGIGGSNNQEPQMDVFRTTDVFGRVNTFMVTIGYYSYGSFQLADVSDPTTPIAVSWVQGSTSASSNYYMMYYYPFDVKVVENEGVHYALVVSNYGSESTSYPNGVQVIKIDPEKTWDLGNTMASTTFN